MRFERFLLVLGDALSFSAAFLLSLALRHIWPMSIGLAAVSYTNAQYVGAFLPALALLIYIFSCCRLYQIFPLETSARIRMVLKAVLIWILAIAFIDYLFKLDLSREIFLTTAFLTGVFICIGRYAFYLRRRHTLNEILKGKAAKSEVFILGRGERSRNIEKRLTASFPGLIIRRLGERLASVDGKGDIAAYLAGREAADIFIADEALGREEVLTLLADGRLLHHRFKLVVDVFRRATGEISLDEIDEIPLISPHQKPQILYLVGKRIFDLIVGILGFVLTLPIWLVIIVCIKFDSSGPIFFRQMRIGKDGKPFLLWKFRTMHAGSISDDYSPRDRNDGRVTRIGKVLRRFSFDELPQLINVLKGDMSIVGPRPEMLFIVETYSSWQRFRLNAKPGITGLWQILGRKDLPLHQNLEYDFYYITSQSFFMDGMIVLKTIPAVFFGKGAY